MRRSVTLFVLALVAAAPASAGDRIVHFKLLPESAVLFGPPTTACSAGTKEIDISAHRPGRSLDASTFAPRPPASSVRRPFEVNSVVWDFGNGDRLFADATATFSFAADFLTAHFRAAGTITGGTGSYMGASGSLKAQGPVSFDELFVPHLNVNTIVELR